MKSAKAAPPVRPFGRRLRCSLCRRAVDDTEFSPEELYGPPELRRCDDCLAQLPHDSAGRPLVPPERGRPVRWSPEHHSSPPHRDSSPTPITPPFPEPLIQPLFEPAAPAQPVFSPPPPQQTPPPAVVRSGSPRATRPPAGRPTGRALTEAQFKELVVGVQSWLQLCKKAFDPDNRVIRSISVVTHVRPQEWLTRHPTARSDFAQIPYECGDEIVARHFHPLLKEAKLKDIPYPFSELIRNFVDRQRPVVSYGRASVQRDRHSADELEALFFETGWQCWALVYRAARTSQRGGG